MPDFAQPPDLRGEALNLLWKAVNLDTARDCLWQMQRYDEGVLEAEKAARRKAFLQVSERQMESECTKAMLLAYDALGQYLMDKGLVRVHFPPGSAPGLPSTIQESLNSGDGSYHP